jgi:hypothetical protein
MNVCCELWQRPEPWLAPCRRCCPHTWPGAGTSPYGYGSRKVVTSMAFPTCMAASKLGGLRGTRKCMLGGVGGVIFHRTGSAVVFQLDAHLNLILFLPIFSSELFFLYCYVVCHYWRPTLPPSMPMLGARAGNKCVACQAAAVGFNLSPILHLLSSHPLLRSTGRSSLSGGHIIEFNHSRSSMCI